ncbi:tryptophan-rich sensory protein [Kocuria rhizophila]|uniref:tryptophan-rich sensory protein n=1 Tax=Kocuria rhizophila TaxID=72000 RepID=UPI001ABE77CF|nr:tryptophan-rich sensory protein [Kocuria rhizophila]WSY88155.1 tryptophan-rich sensory protein [Kocuria rhizophila]WSZ53581.1 tryptophan-rich sensory protein [Kocuria rhizophila]
MSENARLALVTGATGYIGGQVAQELLRRGWRVRLLSRSAEKVRNLPWGDSVVAEGRSAGPGEAEVVEGNASEAADVARALRDVDVAWYLLHSMGDSDDFVREEVEMAETFGTAAHDAHVQRIVYLGGLHPDDEPVDQLSDHLRSRVEVGRALMDSGVPTAALQTGVVIGDESSSFIMIRHLAERLPGAIAPRWVRNRIQPIAVADVVHYLVGAADLPADVNRTFDVGGPEAIEYADMLDQYSRAVGKGPRFMITAPVTTAELAANWIGLVTPIDTKLARPLVGSLQHDTVIHERDLDDYIGAPPGGHTPFADAVRAAVTDLDLNRWRRVFLSTSAAVAATAVVGTLASDPGSTWYEKLRKPRFQPPGWAFPVAWTALYADIAAMGSLSIADLGEEGRTDEQRAYIAALGVNLALNAGWSILFFHRKKLRAAAVESVLLAVSSADLVRRSAKVSPEKGVVLSPYAGWTAFASVLSTTISVLNPRRK